MINGFEIIITPDLPKIQLAEGDYITPAFRKEIDAWLLSFFGTSNLISDGNTVVSQPDKKIWMNPRTYIEIRKSTQLVKEST